MDISPGVVGLEGALDADADADADAADDADDDGFTFGSLGWFSFCCIVELDMVKIGLLFVTRVSLARLGAV